MTEPTDHRAQAERNLRVAGNGTDWQQVQAAAIHAIAHDLHRIADALEPKPVITGPGEQNITGPSGWHSSQAITVPDDQPGPGNVEADFTEDGQIIDEQCDARHLGLRCALFAGHKDHHRGTWPDA